MKYHSKKNNNSRLFVTKDTFSNAYFARTEIEKFARFEFLNNEWIIWIYPYEYLLHEKKLTNCLKQIEKVFFHYWKKTYGDKN